MPTNDPQGLARVGQKEINNHLQGKSGSGTPYNEGPGVRSVKNPNPTSGGGINRSTKGSGSGASDSRQGS